jgi:hypothetical protein
MLVEASFHPTEELLEEYIFGRVRDPVLAVLEEHLLLCDSCQATLHDLEEYACLMKAGLASFEASAKERQSDLFSPLHVPSRFSWTGIVLVCALLLAILATTVPRRSQRTAGATVQLAALRGGEDGGLAGGPANRPLDFSIDATSLPPALGYRLELVDPSGRILWAEAAQQTGPKLSAHFARGADSGVYWVRLYSSGDDQLLREFGLQLQ